MLHMIVATHSPEMCPDTVPEIREKVLAAFQRLEEVSKKLGFTMQGGWNYSGGHIIFSLVDALNAHVIDEMASELGLTDWSVATIYPVVDIVESVARLQQTR